MTARPRQGKTDGPADEIAQLRRRLAALERLSEERDQALAALATSERRFRSLVENMRRIVFYRGNPSGDVDLYGADVQEIAGTLRPDGKANLDWWYAAIHPDDRETYLALEQRRRETGEPFTVEFRYTHPISGRLVWAREHAWTVSGDQGVRFNDGYIIDISAEVAQREELRDATETALLASRTKSEFLANMSHELRTPLNAVIGFAEILATEAFGTIGHPKYQEYAQDILTSATHLLQLIQDVLDMAKAEAGKTELAEEIVDIGELVGATLRMVRERASGKDVTIDTAIAAALPRIHGDSRKLRQILINLLSNAVKFTAEGGTIRVAATERDDGGITVAVTDTGIGMAPEDIPRAMEPFIQIHSGLDREFEGTGLGLPLSAKLAESHGGRLELESTPGAGTTARLILPASRTLRPQP